MALLAPPTIDASAVPGGVLTIGTQTGLSVTYTCPADGTLVYPLTIDAAGFQGGVLSFTSNTAGTVTYTGTQTE